MLARAINREKELGESLVAGRAAFLGSFDLDGELPRYLGAPRLPLRAVRHGFTYGYRRAGDEAIIETLVQHHLSQGRQVRCLEIGAGVTAQWSEISGHRGSPWLSRYLALHHSDKFEVVASDIGRSDASDRLSMSVIHWRDGAEAWEIKAETFTLWRKDTSAALYNRLMEAFASDLGCGVALPASKLGLKAEDFAPNHRADFPRFRESSFGENLIVLPEIAPNLEKSLFNLRFEEGVDIAAPPNSLGRFDVIFGRHLGIAKKTLLDSIPTLAQLLVPGGKIFLWTDYAPYTVLITYQDGVLKHSFPD